MFFIAQFCIGKSTKNPKNAKNAKIAGIAKIAKSKSSVRKDGAEILKLDDNYLDGIFALLSLEDIISLVQAHERFAKPAEQYIRVHFSSQLKKLNKI